MAGKIRTLGPGIFKITDTENGRDFSADLTKAQLNPSNSSDDPVTFLDGSEETKTTTTWTFEGTVGDDFSEDGSGRLALRPQGRDAAGPVRSEQDRQDPVDLQRHHRANRHRRRRQGEEHERSELRRHERRPHGLLG